MFVSIFRVKTIYVELCETNGIIVKGAGSNENFSHDLAYYRHYFSSTPSDVLVTKIARQFALEQYEVCA